MPLSSSPFADSLTQSALIATIPLAPVPACHITYTRDEWVKLLQPPSEYAADQAQLLCQESTDTWVAWVPDHGEVVLNRSNFYC